MRKKNLSKLIYFGLGALILEQVLSNSSSITSGASNIVGTLSGSKYKNFIDAMTPIAAQIKQIYGIDPLITIMQSAEESNWGLSGLTDKANNLFGYTANKAWMDKGAATLVMPSSEYSPKSANQIQYWNFPGDIISKTPALQEGTNLKVNIYFRKYPTWYDSVSDWANLITGASRYSGAYAAAQQGDVIAYADAVQAAGYATDPNYSANLIATASKISSIVTV